MLMPKLSNNIVCIIDIIVSRQVLKSSEKVKEIFSTFSQHQWLVSGHIFQNYTLTVLLSNISKTSASVSSGFQTREN